MAGNRWRIYINPFDDSGNYTTYHEVTGDVVLDSLGTISQDLDNADYSIGIYRNANLSINFRNESGRYSDVGFPTSIFKYKRADSLCKITWEIEEDGPYCGVAVCGENYLSVETDLFIGLIDDTSLSMDLDTQQIAFTLMGRESVLSRTTVPFDLIYAGQSISSVIYTLLNQPSITNLLTVVVGNINVGTDVPLDSIADFQNKTVQDALGDLLLISNSVLYVQNGAIIVSPRIASATVKYNFFGQASSAGVENIQNIKAIKNGVNRLFNYFFWTPSHTSVQDISSIIKYGAKTQEINQSYITNSTSQQLLMAAILNEFKWPKQEFDLFTPLNYGSLSLNLLDQISIDYPTIYIPGDNPLPICGVAICGQAVLPHALWSFTIYPNETYKIIGKSVDPKNALITYKMRAI